MLDADRRDRVLVGRDHERRLLAALVEAGATTGTAALLRGEAGVGRSTLLAEVAAHAGDRRVLRVRGVESEAVLPCAALADLLMPLRTHFAALPDVQREALETGLALRHGAPPAPLALCAAALGVLAAGAEEQPLLILVDDLHWLDPSSSQVLCFVARRIVREPIVLLMAVRDDGPDDRFTGLPTIDLPGLTAADCRVLADRRGIEVSGPVLDRLVEQTAGNALAVVQTLESTDPRILRGSGLDFAGPAIGRSLDRAWTATIDALPAAARRALLVVAACRSTERGAVEPVLAAVGCTPLDVDAAHRAGLVRLDRRHIALRHPLLRPLIVDRSPIAEQAAVHRALAEHADDVERAWYLAAAATRPDAAVADALAAAAVVAHDRNDRLAAALTWARAAELTPDDRRRGERLLAAATDAQLAGESHRAREWCARALELDADPLFVADVVLVRARADLRLGHLTRAVEDLTGAADAVAAVDPARAATLLAEASVPCATAGRAPEAERLAERSLAIDAGADPDLGTVAATALALAIAGRSATSRALLARADRLLAPRVAADDLLPRALAGQAHTLLEQFERAGPVLRTAIEAARTSGSPVALAVTLSISAELGWWTGDWAAAHADGVEGLQWAEELRQPVTIAHTLAALARIDAARGDTGGCRERIDRLRREVEGLDTGGTDVHAPAALGLCALGTGAPDAVAHLAQAWRAAVATGLGCLNSVPFAGDLVEAHIRAGDRTRALAVIDWIDGHAERSGLAHPAAVAARGRAMLATDLASARRHSAEAARLRLRCPAPFERARDLLGAGEALRRLHHPGEARGPLQDAAALFERLGARPWLARAEAEIAATGAVRAPRPDGPGLESLTPQEFQIARLVGDGLNNLEAAAALFISRKTVEAHLTRIYRKIGVRSRTDLARRIGQGEAAAPPQRVGA
jgi:DNA-binding CsgD family transcriptional regulator/tetratricopeptide (TPR) repeat protein